MLEYLKQKKFLNIEKIRAFLAKKCSFTVTGLTSFLRLTTLALAASQKRVIFVTATEQNCLKYKHDLEKFYNTTAKIFPYQDVSIYDGVAPNLYKYAQQTEIIRNLDKEELLLVPVRALLEKFPQKSFYKNNLIEIKTGDEIDTAEFAKKLVNLGYKRVTMVSDIGEFSVRGDIIDVFSF